MQIGEIWFRQLVNAMLQGSLALAFALLAVVVFKNISPVIRVWILRLAMAKVIIAFCWIGGIAVGEFQPPVSNPFMAPAISGALLIAFSFWFLAVGIGVWRQYQSFRQVDRFLGECNEVLDWETKALLNRFTGTHKVRLFSHASQFSPFLAWCNGYVVVVPTDLLADEERTRLRIALAHEASHYRNSDLAWNALKCVLDLLFFFNPLVSLVIRRLRLCEEFAADARAMKLTDCSPSQYSNTLLSFVKGSPVPTNSFALAEGALELDSRIKESFAGKRSRPWARKAATVAGLAMAALILVPLTLNQPDSEPVAAGARVFSPMAR